MAKFKVGDRVRLLDNVYAGENTASGNIGTIIPYVGQRGDYQVRLEDYPEGLGFYGYELELIGGTMNFKVGDVLVDKYGHDRKVLAYLNQGVEMYAVSYGNDHDSFSDWLTQHDLEGDGYKLKTDTTVEKSVAEIEKELGLASGTLRVKKDN